MQMKDAGISVVVPVYNSENTLPELVRRLEEVLSAFREYEIILVDDLSRDKSWEVIKELAKSGKSVIGVNLRENSGQQCAILCSLRHALFEYTVIIDDDLEQSPEDIIALYNKMQQGYDAVYGIPRYSGARSAGSHMRDVLFNALTDIPKGIKVSSFRMMNEKTREAVISADTRFVYISMEILKHTNNIANVDIKSGPKAASNYSFSKLLKLYANIFKTYCKCPLFKKAKAKGQCYEISKKVGGGMK
jgi:glycosyltransferase involved in cell wall biosynthesis